jgi:hypothetical protein
VLGGPPRRLIAQLDRGNREAHLYSFAPRQADLLRAAAVEQFWRSAPV